MPCASTSSGLVLAKPPFTLCTLEGRVRLCPDPSSSVNRYSEEQLAEIVTKNENFVGNFHIFRKRERAHVRTDVQKALIFNRPIFHVP